MNTQEEKNSEDTVNAVVNAIAEFCNNLGNQGVPPSVMLYALDINHAMVAKVIIDQSYAAMRSASSEGSKGG